MLREKRLPVIAGNWKMNKTVPEAVDLAGELRGDLVGLRERVEIVLAPAYTALQAVAKVLEESDLRLSAQNCHWAPSGAYTGEVSAPMLQAVGCRYVILGHSERRQHFGETDDTVNKRARAVVAARMIPILCVGETLAEREAKQTLAVVSRQLFAAVNGFTPVQAEHFVIAYEPVWAIGTGRNATSEQAQEVHAHIREELVMVFGREVGERIRIQYGGSVKAENAAELLAQPDVDGALVGGASLKASEFSAIVRAAS